MKKKNSKNYIAFTLTEMTMVLLIMSVIAAVSAPLVKHAVSDVVSTSAPTVAENPWRKLASLQGIFYSSVGNGMVSVGTIPSGNAVNYDYPVLAVQSNDTNNASDTAQIGFYSGNADTTPKLSLDRYNNILAGLGTSKKVSGFDSIEIGKYVGVSNADGTHINIGSNIKKYNDIFVGSINTENSIAIGDNITSYGNFSNDSIVIGSQNSNFAYSILIGQNIKPQYSYRDIYIGNMAGLNSYGNSYIAIGFGAGYANKYPNFEKSVQNVNIGTYAGALLNNANTHNDVNIGKYAGLKTDNGQRYANVAIGYGALAPVDFNKSPVNATYLRSENVAIGTSAGATNRSVVRSVMIGAYAGLNKDFDSANNIAIGPFANTNSIVNLKNNIAIGYYAGYKQNAGENNVFIGAYAGYNGASTKSMYIGNYAGYQARNAIGIGYYACAFVTTSRAFCFGDFMATMAKTKTPSDNEMLLYAGYLNSPGNDGGAGDIVLAAKNVYAPGTVKLISSDARSKRNIALARYGIKDFRKFNIYNFTLKYDKDHLKHIGVIAQEYRKAFPLAILKGGKYLSIQPDWLYYSMINAVKDLDRLVQEFQVKLDEYINNFDSVKTRINALENTVAQEKANNANMRKQLDEINAKLNKK